MATPWLCWSAEPESSIRSVCEPRRPPGASAGVGRPIEQVIVAGPFAADWDSLKAYRVPSWYEDGKFGIFIHWGVYSVPAFGNEWYPRNMYVQGSPEYEHHLATYGAHANFGYKDFIPQFTADKFDPQHWANLFRGAGARFIMPVAEHHDGFQLYASELSEWNATNMGPRRDVIGDLAEAVRREFLVFAVSSHRAEHWWFFNGGMAFDSDVRDPPYAGLYAPAQAKTLQPNQEFLDDWLARTCEVVDKYRPRVVWFDWWIEDPAFEPFSALCREIGEKEHIVATAWTLNHPAVNSAIVGVRAAEQLAGIERAAELELTPEMIRRLEGIFNINQGRPLGSGAAPEAYSW